ncbi:hypothetical protein DP939_13390 [Spongiactinospora rosea]|uniref:Uncharacterized protein n=1 Tax=Spongiactinospora rosea TaxID=2248750 RepID=A0A366M0J7_9ACTN|nr:hypothetical protein [Spongiactinospora rosea]RBQ19715.1 hypothetical protein DP939_13390 [Spongiactinospora rosea]
MSCLTDAPSADPGAMIAPGAGAPAVPQGGDVPPPGPPRPGRRDDPDEGELRTLLIATWVLTTWRIPPGPLETLSVEELIEFWADERTVTG